MPTLLRIAPEIPATDLQKSVAYYTGKLGFRVALEMADRNYVIVERDEIAIHLFWDDRGEHSPTGIHIFTENLDDLYAELREHDADLAQEIERKPWGNREFRVNDPSGNELKFTEPLSE